MTDPTPASPSRRKPLLLGLGGLVVLAAAAFLVAGRVPGLRSKGDGHDHHGHDAKRPRAAKPQAPME
ncbi:hypothetical protein ACLESD_15330, partial [Pyxidicoccus sp. 3LFB2]